MCTGIKTEVKDSKANNVTVPEPTVHGRKAEIVDELMLAGNNGRSSRELASAIFAPVPSVRRDVAELRAKGYRIDYDGDNGVYILN